MQLSFTARTVYSTALALVAFVACGGDEDPGTTQDNLDASSGGDVSSDAAGGNAGEMGSSGSGGANGGSGGSAAGSGGAQGGGTSGSGGASSGGGSSGDGGTSGGGGSGGAVNELCGNGSIDDGEECDDSNTVDGDGCSSYCTSACEACWQQQCPDQVPGCFEMEGVAILGLAAGAPLKDLCAETMRCMWENDCARADIAECYCGPYTEVPLEDCLTGSAAGPCKEEFEYAAESTSAADIELRIGNVDYALGAAGQLVICNQLLCPHVCFKGTASADGGI